ncbi:SDR family NAD(P)-dependent oxidoreductase [Aliarcobacter cibarius]|jgi:short-subunit dehydrogenase|uniref:SDR family NAD(P)-dependent oxidoreductase n=1 Tax=Aliarcobacter cibarius TaxID=255507 RepID=A0A5J6RGZ2_9BACT|nr:SDR family NAD(P)-dependent oxidoreductase [Aliarcobacter cibarius]QEZ89185.1 short-chain dehydrogenase/reductase [Aliarcobacter cibarius]QKJ27220.1 short-chain dehydrogenase/reductase [Aliarcobacter cibarius]TLT01561.1 SDR family NAD(P)-dependent oxidoreductase [Aliarcobacter cibarius]TLT02052.1 SDR family NAD(P)-dependent oxidoreductase [Aliarcobacter cibarius]TLT04106.1 SDR family NAD(P)-dependent oxidoreductase [Aliarcobacter cibarius]
MTKKVWIIGASSGIGLELVKLWLENNFQVIASSRDIENSTKLLELKSKYLTNLELINIDVLDNQNVEKTVSKVFNIFNGLDICFYNAGVYESMSYEEWNISNFESMIDINYLGVLRVLKPLIVNLEKQKQKSNIVLNASLASCFGLPYGGAYSASKAALVNIAQSLQPELQRKNIYLQIINHGFVKTRLTAKNDFEMPQLMEVDYAAKKIFDELNKSYKFEISFPFMLSKFLRILSFLPYSWSFSITKKFLK